MKQTTANKLIDVFQYLITQIDSQTHKNYISLNKETILNEQLFSELFNEIKLVVDDIHIQTSSCFFLFRSQPVNSIEKIEIKKFLKLEINEINHNYLSDDDNDINDYLDSYYQRILLFMSKVMNNNDLSI
jgi:hypothetical protein